MILSTSRHSRQLISSCPSCLSCTSCPSCPSCLSCLSCLSGPSCLFCLSCLSSLSSISCLSCLKKVGFFLAAFFISGHLQSFHSRSIVREKKLLFAFDLTSFSFSFSFSISISISPQHYEIIHPLHITSKSSIHFSIKMYLKLSWCQSCR